MDLNEHNSHKRLAHVSKNGTSRACKKLYHPLRYVPYGETAGGLLYIEPVVLENGEVD